MRANAYVEPRGLMCLGVQATTTAPPAIMSAMCISCTPCVEGKGFVAAEGPACRACSHTVAHLHTP